MRRLIAAARGLGARLSLLHQAGSHRLPTGLDVWLWLYLFMGGGCGAYPRWLL